MFSAASIPVAQNEEPTIHSSATENSNPNSTTSLMSEDLSQNQTVELNPLDSTSSLSQEPTQD